MNNLLYQELLQDYYRNPRNRGVIEGAPVYAELHNPSCGDSVIITASIEGDCISQMMFTGQGCVISQATASLLTEQLAGESFPTILAYDKDYLLQLLAIPLGPVRLKCALLPLQAVQQAISTYMQETARARSHLTYAGTAKKS